MSRSSTARHTAAPSIFRRLTIGLTLTIAGIAIIAVSFFYFRAVQDERLTLSKKADEYLAYLVGTLEIPLWNFDVSTIKVISQSFAQNELITAVTIKSKQGGDSLSEIIYSTVKGDDSETISRSGLITHNDTIIGEVELSLTQEVYRQNARKLLLSFIMMTGIVLIALLLVTGFFLRFFFKRPLDNLNALVDSYASGIYDQTERGVQYQEFKPLEMVLGNMGAQINRQLDELREAEKNYRSIFENALEGIYQITPEGRFITANPATARILGYESADQLVSEQTDIAEAHYLRSNDRQVLLEELQKRGELNKFEIQFKHKKGGTIWVELSARAIKDANGSIRRIEGHMADITSQKMAETEKARLQEQLQQAQKMEALGSLTGGIAHDFNNLLQAISGYIQLMLIKKKPDDPDFTSLTEVNRAAERASELVKRLLTFSRKMEISFQPVSMNDVIRVSTGLLERTIPKMVAITIDLEPNLPVIQADANQMEQVIMNLANNAVDAMEGAGTLSIATTSLSVDSGNRAHYSELPPGDYIEVKVTDSGLGMSEETRQRIFEPFFTTKELGKGTGLGLSMVYGIVKGHKGYITCASEQGSGTVIRIFLPVQTSSQAVHHHDEKVLSSSRGGTETILLVDDEALIRKICDDLLSDYGYRVLKASSGEEALELYADDPLAIDLVILDLGMPGIGGEHCLSELLKLNPAVKVIVASGYSTHKIAKAPQQFGALSFLSKPYKLNVLLAMVRAALDTHPTPPSMRH